MQRCVFLGIAGQMNDAERGLHSPPPRITQMDVLRLPSGLNIEAPEDRLLAFCQEEYAFYDEIEYSNPDRIEPLDVLATVSVNSFINNAAAVRKIQRGLSAKCEPILRSIAVECDLLSEVAPLDLISDLFEAAVSVPDVLIPKATKILHRKRRFLIPMLDNVVLFFYLDALGESTRKARTQDKRAAASVAMDVLRYFRQDLTHASRAINELRQQLSAAGYNLSPVRILEILVWTETERNGYYRHRATI